MAMNLVSPLSVQLHQQIMYQHQMVLRHYQQEEITSASLGASGWSTLLASSMPSGPKLNEDVKVELENKKLWQQFHSETTEMIITKSGRRMFPSIQLALSGLERRSRYCVLLELKLASDRRHKYSGGVDGARGAATTGPRGWTSAGPAEPQPSLERRLYVHPDSPATGAHWMQHPLSFSKLKLTNNVGEQHRNVLLTSMHKYVPCIRIVRCDEINDVRDLYNNPSASFQFRETEFIAVTAYQNENITKLKIDNNPFAKGFRESGQSACKRKRLRADGCTSSSTSEISSHDEEEGNVSSSDSDHNEPGSDSASPPLAKRPRLHDENCNVSTTCSVPSCSPSRRHQEAPAASAQQPRRETPQPRLHRPWTDDAEADADSIRADSARCLEQRLALESLPVTSAVAQIPLGMSQYPGYMEVHYQTMLALQLANMSQMRERLVAAAAHHLPPGIMDYRRTI